MNEFEKAQSAKILGCYNSVPELKKADDVSLVKSNNQLEVDANQEPIGSEPDSTSDQK